MEKIQIIKPGSNINLNIGDAFYKRLQELATYFSQTVAPEELALQIQHIKDNSEKLSEYGNHFETIIVLLNEIEQKAIEQNLVEEVEVNLPEQSE